MEDAGRADKGGSGRVEHMKVEVESRGEKKVGVGVEEMKVEEGRAVEADGSG